VVVSTVPDVVEVPTHLRASVEGTKFNELNIACHLHTKSLHRFSKRGGFSGSRNYFNANQTTAQRVRESSIKVGNDWKMKEEIDFTRLNKLWFEVDEPEDL
jgi:hypothetical protein